MSVWQLKEDFFVFKVKVLFLKEKFKINVFYFVNVISGHFLARKFVYTSSHKIRTGNYLNLTVIQLNRIHLYNACQNYQLNWIYFVTDVPLTDIITGSKKKKKFFIVHLLKLGAWNF